MNQSAALVSTVIFVFVCLLNPQIAAVHGQTNFVKYQSNPVLPLGDTGEWDAGGAAFVSVLKVETTYHMWYSGSAVAGSTQRQIGYATSEDGINWVKYANNPVLGVGAPGEFDDYSVWLPWVLLNGSTYEMWYVGDAGNNNWSIGYATASNPTDWTKHPDNPVLIGGRNGEFDAAGALLPVVVRNNNFYLMWYTGRSANGLWQTGFAVSTDGINWDKHASNPVLTVGMSGSWDDNAALGSSVIYDDAAGEYRMWYHGDDDNVISNIEIGYATSPNGINWTKSSESPILRPSINEWDNDNVWFSRVLKGEDGIYRMWFSGKGNGVDRLGYAEDTTGAVTGIEAQQVTQPRHFRLSQNYPNPFNPSTVISYDVPATAHVELRIYNQLGQEIRILVNTGQPAGTHKIIWDGRDSRGNVVPAGVYFYRLQAGAVVETRKMILLK